MAASVAVASVAGATEARAELFEEMRRQQKEARAGGGGERTCG